MLRIRIILAAIKCKSEKRYYYKTRSNL